MQKAECTAILRKVSNMDKFCQNCNQPNPAEAAFCLNCAAPLARAQNVGGQTPQQPFNQPNFGGQPAQNFPLPHRFGVGGKFSGCRYVVFISLRDGTLPRRTRALENDYKIFLGRTMSGERFYGGQYF